MLGVERWMVRWRLAVCREFGNDPLPKAHMQIEYPSLSAVGVPHKKRTSNLLDSLNAALTGGLLQYDLPARYCC